MALPIELTELSGKVLMNTLLTHIYKNYRKNNKYSKNNCNPQMLNINGKTKSLTSVTFLGFKIDTQTKF